MKKMLLVALLSSVMFQTAQASTVRIKNGAIDGDVLTCKPFFLDSQGKPTQSQVESTYDIVSCDDSVEKPGECLTRNIKYQRDIFVIGEPEWFCKAKDNLPPCKIWNSSDSDNIELITQCKGVATPKFRRHYIGHRFMHWCGIVGFASSVAALTYITCCKSNYTQKYTKASMLALAASLGTLMAGCIWKWSIQYCSGLSLDCLTWGKDGRCFEYRLNHRCKEVTFSKQ